MGRLIFSFVLLLFISCKRELDLAPAFNYRCGLEDNITVQDIREVVKRGTLYVDDNLVFEGTVIANDYYDNFFRSVFIADQTGGLELLVGMYDMHLQFPIGRTLHISMQDLTIDMHNGVVRVGLSENSLNVEAPGYFNYYYILDDYLCDCLAFTEIAEPDPISILDLSSDMCGELVTVTDIICDRSGLMWAEAGRDLTYFKDDFNNKIVVQTSQYSQFASELVPDGEITITGVLSLQNIDDKLVYTLKIRNLNDVSSR